MKLELVATATFGLEAVVRREIEALGYKIIRTEDGRVTYMGDERAIVRSNLWLRSADRVYIRMGEFTAREFEELFQQTKGIPWEDIIPADGSFPVVGGSVKSVLHSVPACQSIIKKAVVSRLADFYCTERLPETGAEYRIRFIAHKDSFLMLLDTSGAGLHKRGYRVSDVAAPIKETLAASLVQLSFYNKDRVLVDPCCGSGTIPIEAAMIARNIAPGLSRDFASMKWDMIPDEIWREEKRLAFEAADFDTELSITAMDIDKRAVRAAKANAEEAGVIDDIDFICMDMTQWQPGEGIPKGVQAGEHGVVISNLPYGVRIGDDKSIRKLYTHFAELMQDCPEWSFFLITSDKELEKDIEKKAGRKADRRRKLYNGTIETQFYQYHGERPRKAAEQRDRE
ncbi:MAG: class I SAM-dependent RNA methyltransferase [Mogibacterium sp.]|nr:class I SAM-dependent RNA methyltransferase [Mogibacterium sp.]